MRGGLGAGAGIFLLFWKFCCYVQYAGVYFFVNGQTDKRTKSIFLAGSKQDLPFGRKIFFVPDKKITFSTWIGIMCSFCMHETEEDVSKRKTCSSEEKDWDTKILKIENKKIDKILFKNETNLRLKYSLIQITFMIACLIGTLVVICYSCIFGSWKS